MSEIYKINRVKNNKVTDIFVFCGTDIKNDTDIFTKIPFALIVLGISASSKNL